MSMSPRQCAFEFPSLEGNQRQPRTIVKGGYRPCEERGRLFRDARLSLVDLLRSLVVMFLRSPMLRQRLSCRRRQPTGESRSCTRAPRSAPTQSHIHRQRGGRLVTTEIDIEAKLAFIPAYAFSHRSEEAWRAGRLTLLNSETVEQGQRRRVEGAATLRGFSRAERERPLYRFRHHTNVGRPLDPSAAAASQGGRRAAGWHNWRQGTQGCRRGTGNRWNVKFRQRATHSSRPITPGLFGTTRPTFGCMASSSVTVRRSSIS